MSNDHKQLSFSQKLLGSYRYSGKTDFSACEKDSVELYFEAAFKGIWDLLEEVNLSHEQFQEFIKLEQLPDSAQDRLRSGKYSLAKGNKKATSKELGIMARHREEHGEWPSSEGSTDFEKLVSLNEDSATELPF